MKKDNQISHIPDEHVREIAKVANELALAALPLMKLSPAYALASLSMATGLVAAMMRAPYDDLMEMVSKHYENCLLDLAMMEEGIPFPTTPDPTTGGSN